MQQTNNDTFSNLTIDRVMPSEFVHLINQEKYDTIIDIILSYFKNIPGELKGVTDGMINVNREKGIVQYSLFNLVRRLIMRDKAKWKEAIYQFLEDEVNIPAYRFFLKDYEHARKYLKVLIKHAGFVEGETTKNTVSLQHLPGTVSCLVLHFEQKFVFLQHEFIKEWGVSVEELFAEAIKNVSQEELHTSICRLEKDLEYTIMMSDQYSAAKMLDIKTNFPHLIGKYGTLFSIPANGLVFAAPLHERKNAVKLLEPFISITSLGYKQEPSPIVNDIFHYQEGNFSSLLNFITTGLPELYTELKRKHRR